MVCNGYFVLPMTVSRTSSPAVTRGINGWNVESALEIASRLATGMSNGLFASLPAPDRACPARSAHAAIAPAQRSNRPSAAAGAMASCQTAMTCGQFAKCRSTLGTGPSFPDKICWMALTRSPVGPVSSWGALIGTSGGRAVCFEGERGSQSASVVASPICARARIGADIE